MTDAALPSSEDLFEHAACGLLVTAADGCIRRANAQLCRWLGFAHEELVGQRLQVLLTLAGRLLHEEHWGPQLRRRGTVAGVRLEMRHRDGRAVPLMMNARTRSEGPEPLHELAVMRMSERGQGDEARRRASREGARRALEESQQVLGLAIRGARMGAWSRDLATNQVWWSPELEELMGLPPGGFAGNEAAFLELVHEADRVALDAAITRALALRSDYIVEFRFRHSSGRWRWMEGRGRALYDENGAATTIHGLAIDVTERKEAELILIRQAAIFEYQTDAIVIAGMDGAIVDANPACCRMLGASLRDLLGQPVTEHFLFPDGSGAGRAPRELSSWDGAERHELVFVRRDGSRGICESVVMPLSDAKGTVYGSIGISRDVSDRRRDEDELRRLNAELSRADRRKDEFIATLAHELRNPLAPMRNVLEILRLKDLSDPQLQWSRAVLERQMKHMTHLVDDLLEVARITRGKVDLRRERVELASAVHAAVEGVRPLVQAAHELVVQLPATPVVLEADPTRLTQVILNLLNNAVKYTPDGGRIQVVAEREGDEAVVTVRDSGIGIPPEHLGSVFEMFSQLAPAIDRSQGGLGIGLSLVRGLVELHGGSVQASSAGPGQGSAFSIRLPAPRTLDGAASEPAAQAGVSLTKRRVLVVDDNVDAADSLSMALALAGHEIRTVHDGAAALAAAEAFAPEVILLDIGLPRLNGYEVARRIRTRPWGRAIRIVAVTGWGQAQDKQAAYDAGFDHHVTKPVELPELEGLIALGLPVGR
jgi:PAS domain S-box-containing protein